MTGFITKRFVLSLIGLGLSSLLCYQGKLPGDAWVYALAVILAGHHAVDLVKAWRGQNVGNTP